jgi:O-methyltransferase involved in polyketide biosynthesis
MAASTGVTMYLTKDATAATLRQLAGLAPGSTVAMTFLLSAGRAVLRRSDRRPSPLNREDFVVATT